MLEIENKTTHFLKHNANPLLHLSGERERMQHSLPSPPSAPPLTSFLRDQSKATRSVVIATLFFSFLFLLSLSSTSSSHSIPSQPDPFLFPSRPTFPSKIPSYRPPPSIAYLISGSSGESNRLLRLLLATYHPKNQYLLHLDSSAPQAERDRLALTVQSVPLFRAAQNVNVIGKADFSYQSGSSTISSTLHGASILLKLSKNWDWFISLNAADYPLVSQDDLLHILSYLPKELNFVNHTSYIGWKESSKLKRLIVDPGLFLSAKSAMFYVSQKRELPKAFRLFSGSTFFILSRSFIEYSILGTDNLPRTLLMYLSNTPYSLPNYFPTILCNSHQFNKTIINDNLLYVAFDKSSKENRTLNSTEFDAMIESGAIFASHFRFDDPVLERIDAEILNRSPGNVVPGGWCLGEPGNSTCSVWGDADVLRPGPGSRRLEKHLVELLSDGKFRSRQCILE
ncbi:beta-glucuronosyltransferase GlcAT14A-like [Melia azedarach]|uniref:Beta-glucuronosyltransferase GlcAT14A-like n=1 Tax=Melia azedarach TaxID=155640 RepID=A0ACC1YIE6_MELAZ|nr:beta-glucuronosyltransferase GlcAT14A-like [Melia azedarach]